MKQKPLLIDLDDKKDAQILQDMAMTPLQRWEKMFQLIEFSVAFSKDKKLLHDEKENCFTLKKKQ